MQGTDRNILLVIPAIALLLFFYFMVLGPKRQEASKLDEDISTLHSQIDTQEQTAAFAEDARQDFPKYYGNLVVLGKAVPETADSASLLVQLNSIAQRSKVDFRGLEVTQGSADPAAAAAATPPPAAPAAGTAPETTPASTDASAAPASDPTAVPTTPTPATEASAANLPIGATIGTAGLPTLPYNLTFRGTFFDLADFFAGVDGLVGLQKDDNVSANGRLITVDGFVIKGGIPGSDPLLDTTLTVTTFVTPPAQGLTGGATPGGLGSPTTTPTSAATTPASTGVTP
jgi:Tfp pilus assembly protein PilO